MSQSLPFSLRATAARQPDAPAIEWRGAGWSYGDLQRAIDAVARLLSSKELPKGSRIALLLRNSPQYIACYYASLLCGFVAVPLNAQERANVLARQIEHCGAALVVADSEHPEWAPLTAAIQTRSIAMLAFRLEPGAAGLASLLEAAPREAGIALDAPQATDLASIIYTSGTTGRPKGVMLSHRNLLANTQAIIEYLELTSNDRGLCVLPFHFSYGNSVLHTHLLAGAQLAIEDNFAFPQATLQRLQTGAFTGFAGVPSTFALLLGRCRLCDFDLSHLRYVTQAGGPMPRPLLEQLREQVPAVKVFVMYGQTEATARLTYLAPDKLEAKLGSIGQPIRGVEIEIRKDGRVAPANVTGELHARGPNIMLGYWNDPAATADVVQDGWLNTGDLAHRDDDGFLYIDGRLIDMIKVGAFRVSPQEVEEVLAGLDGVEEVGVTGVPDELLGQSIKAVIVPRPNSQLQILAVKAHCRQHLASYKVPKYIEFAASLPRTTSGKVQRFKLA